MPLPLYPSSSSACSSSTGSSSAASSSEGALWIAIAAGKGGVGKSTITLQLARCLSRLGQTVGILDADLYGPSMRQMLPEDVLPEKKNERLIPARCGEIGLISLAYFRPEQESIAVRGPIANQLIAYFLQEVDWSGYSTILVDFPPGTGDIQLSLCQRLRFAGAILVTTPQLVSVLDVRKSAHFFQQMHVPLKGVIENMSYFVDPISETPHYLFGKDGGTQLASELGIPLLGQIPLSPSLCQACDLGYCLAEEPSLDGKRAQKACDVIAERMCQTFCLSSALSLFFLPLLLLLCIACSSSPSACDTREWKAAKQGHRVLATTAMIGDVVSRVGGDSIHCLTLICGELDPHSYQLVKGDDEKLALAEAIFCNGLGLEHGPSLAEALRDHPLAYAVGDYIAREHPEQILYVETQIDPHIWMDVSLWSKMVPYVRDRLIQLDPDHRALYMHNSEQLISEMESVHQEIQEKLAQVPPDKRYIVTSHDAFQYFTRAYLATPKERHEGGWEPRFAAPEGLAPESQVSARDIQMILEHLLRYHIQVLFPESNLNRDALRKIVQAAREKGLEVRLADVALYGDAMGPKGSEGATYIGMLRHNAAVIDRFLMGAS